VLPEQETPQLLDNGVVEFDVTPERWLNVIDRRLLGSGHAERFSAL
jgi:hypothetical protein